MSRPAGGGFRDHTEDVIALAELAREIPLNVRQHLILMEWHAREANRVYTQDSHKPRRPNGPAALRRVA